MLATLLSGFSEAVLGPVTYFLAVGTLISLEVGCSLPGSGTQATRLSCLLFSSVDC